MELEYMIYVKLEDGSKEEIIMWADEDYSRDELSALAHEKVVNNPHLAPKELEVEA